MANSKEKKKGLKQEVIGIALLFVSLLLIISLFSSFHPTGAVLSADILPGFCSRL